ncbi:hypothetical protein GUJ93_ZPchr0014g47145 [Zizania palustris]|uniref:Uncharacterized protein n=1 Tax=Zizania palustris TaxID=103762 RepID=A0A8J5T8S8_ZIZPA|nr:hypothetical protein GUJ93_ZPchr0014g47145 [Zizania palustris]
MLAPSSNSCPKPHRTLHRVRHGLRPYAPGGIGCATSEATLAPYQLHTDAPSVLAPSPRRCPCCARTHRHKPHAEVLCLARKTAVLPTSSLCLSSVPHTTLLYIRSEAPSARCMYKVGGG